jgi:NADP-dependent 3-hydroxy acid dehydrogenase YdfG
VTATALSENGARVYITGRRMEPLKAAAREEKDGKGAIIPIQADVSTKEGITSMSPNQDIS